MKSEYEGKHKDITDQVKSKLLDRYGGDAHTKPMAKELLFGETEAFVEYSRDGRVLRGAVRRYYCASLSSVDLHAQKSTPLLRTTTKHTPTRTHVHTHARAHTYAA